MAYAIEVNHLTKKYKKTKINAVDDISFKVKAGEFFAFLGPNGAGKTTTISILTTTLSKTSGNLIIAGFDIDKNAAKVRKNIGVIFQNPSLDQKLTAEENIRFHALLYGLYPYRPAFAFMDEGYKKRVFELAKIIGIKNEIFRPVETFSGGMKRKLEIIRSLMHKPKVLFLDEPTSGLDPVSRQNLWNYLNKVRKSEKTTIFLTTHYLEEAENADSVVIINHGKIVSSGTPEKIKEELTNEYLLINAKDREKLIKELKAKRIKFLLDTHIRIDISMGKAQELITKIKTKLNYLKIVSPSLEEAYLKIISNDENI